MLYVKRQPQQDTFSCWPVPIKKSQVNGVGYKQKMHWPLHPSCCPKKKTVNFLPNSRHTQWEDGKENMNSHPLEGIILKEIKSTSKNDLEFSCKEELSSFKCG